MASGIPARDQIGHNCGDDENARFGGNFIAHRIGREKREMIREGDYISVTREDGREIARISLVSTPI